MLCLALCADKLLAWQPSRRIAPGTVRRRSASSKTNPANKRMTPEIAKENTHPEIRRERQGEISDNEAVKDITAKKTWAAGPDNSAREEPRARMGKARQ